MSVATSEARTAAPEVRTPDPHVIVLFGATGDLARRKLLPGLYHLASAGLMPEGYRIICTSRRDIVDDETRSMAREAVDEFGREPTTTESWEAFAASLTSVSVGSGLGPLIEAVAGARAEIGDEARLLHYLSVPPASADFVRELGEAGLNERARIIMEKPFGVDLASARELNASVLSVFDESQVFGSTTTSAARRCRTCSRCVSRTACSSRCGTATTSTTSRSTSPRRFRSAREAASTTASARFATWS